MSRNDPAVPELKPPPLSEQERRVLSLRYNASGEAVATYQALAEQLGLSRDQVRRLNVIAKEKLARLAQADSSGSPIPAESKADLDTFRALLDRQLRHNV